MNITEKRKATLVNFVFYAFIIAAYYLFMKFASSVSLAIFPTFCNYDEEKLKNIYNKLNFFVDILMICAMCFYYPAKLILTKYLPSYEDSFIYMGYLLPICLQAYIPNSSKSSGVISTP